MKNWKGFLNYLKSLINHIAKIFFLILLFNIVCSSQEKTKDSVFVMHKSPWGAVLRSAILPGWGQIYNESYLKAPIIWGVSSWLVFNWIQSNNQYQDYKNLAVNNQRFIITRDEFRDQRDLFVIYMGLTYLLNLVDAYVDAHLFDFNVEEDTRTGTQMMGVKVKF